MDYRHELKYLITPSDGAGICTKLRVTAKPDPHVGEKGYYTIRSLYFDDMCNTALHQKLDGISRRRKYRIRCYDQDLSYLVLECKIREGTRTKKLREPVTLEEVERILRGETDWMLGRRRPLFAVFYEAMKLEGLRPKAVVEYRRIPYIYEPGNVRVTLDWNLRAGMPEQFLLPKGLTVPVADQVMLMEIKWDEYLPQIIARAAALKGRRPTSFSKYAACRIYF